MEYVVIKTASITYKLAPNTYLRMCTKLENTKH